MFMTFFLLFSLFICRHAESQEIYIVEFVLLSPVYAISELDSDSKKLHQAKCLQLQKYFIVAIVFWQEGNMDLQ